MSSQAEKLICVNKGRQRVVRDTGSYRVLQSSQQIATNLEVLPFGGITGVQIVAGGTGGTNGSQVVTFTGGGGSGATATATIAGGIVTAIAVTATGLGYTSAPTVSVANAGVAFSGVAGFIHANTIDMLNLSLYWGNSRFALNYLPWTAFNAKARYYNKYVGRPSVFSVYSSNSVYIGPIPDQPYLADFDSVQKPPDIVDATTIEVIPEPFKEPVSFYAAYLIKMKEQSWGEAEEFKKQYQGQMMSSINSSYTRRIRSAYTA
jgi:hypothetical protein